MEMVVDREVVKKLDHCRTEKEIEAVFQAYGIVNAQDKMMHLRACTGETETYYSDGDSLTDEQRYLDDVCAFLEGSWRLFKN